MSSQKRNLFSTLRNRIAELRDKFLNKSSARKVTKFRPLMENLEDRLAPAAGDLLISEYLANPAGNDTNQEWVELVATKTINFATTPYSVIWTNNGTATAAGWKAGGALSYGFNITSGTVNAGDVFYVGGTGMLAANTPRLRQIDITTTGGDGGLGNSAATAGVLGNGGANADSIGVFDLPIASVTNTTVPIDAVFFGTGTGTAVVSGGTAGFVLPNNDLYTGGFLQTTSFVALDSVSANSTIATGTYNTTTGTWTTPRTFTNSATPTSAATAITLNNSGNSVSIAATDASKTEGDTGNTAFTFTVTRTGTGTASVDWAVTGSGANPADAADFGGTLPNGTVNFTGTQTTATVTVNVSGDTTNEPDEGFTVTLSNPTGGLTISQATATGTIVNDDFAIVSPAGDVSIIGYNTSGAPDTFTILLMKDLPAGYTFFANDNEVATAGGTTFTDLNEGEAQFTANANLARGTVITLPWGAGAVSNDLYSWGNTNGFGLSNNNEEIYLYQANSITDLTPTAFIYYAQIGTSTSSVPAGLTSGQTAINPQGTAARYKLTAPQTGTQGGLLANIGNTSANWEGVAPVNNNDWAFTVNNGATDAVIALSTVTYTQAEGNTGSTNAVLTLTRTGNLGNTVSVNFATSDGTATAGSDYTAVNTTVTFNPGETVKTVNIPVIGDTTPNEGDETVNITLNAPAVVTGGGTASLGTQSTQTLTIIDDDAAAPAGVLLNEFLVNPPGNDGPNEYFELINTTSNPINLSNVYLVVIEGENGTAAAGTADFVVNLSSAGSIPANSTLTIRGANNNLRDWTGVLSFIDSRLDGSGSIIENGSNTYLLVYGATAPVETTDYDVGNTGVLTLPAGSVVLDSVGYQDSGVGTVYGPVLPRKAGATPDAASRVAGNTVPNTTAWFYGDLETNLPLRYIEQTLPSNAPLGASITPGAANTASPNGHIRFVSAGFSGNEGGTITVQVERVGGTAGQVSITVTTQDLSNAFFGTESFRAAAGADYTALTGFEPQAILTWAPGESGVKTVTINLTQDTDAEGNEAFEIALSAPTGGATYQVPPANGIINADDLATTAPVGVVINEIAVDKDGFDGPYEYIELRNTTGSPVSLQNVKVVSVESEGGPTDTTFTGATWTQNGILTLNVPVGSPTATSEIDKFFVGDQVRLAGFSSSTGATINGDYIIQSVRRTTTTGAEVFSISVAFPNDPGTITVGTGQPTDAFKPGTFDYVFDLTALNSGTPVTIPANGFVLIKSPNYNPAGIPGSTVVLNDARFDTPGGILENGANSFLLVYSPTALTQATNPSGGFYQASADYDQDNNGSLEALPSGAVLLDGFGWGASSSAGDINYGTFLTSRYTDFGNPGFASRGTGDTTPFSTNAWRTGEVYFANPPGHNPADEAAASSELRLDYANSNAPAGSALTPGAANTLTANAAGGFRFVGSTYVTVAETGGTTVTFTVERVDGATGAATVTWTITNGTTQDGDTGTKTGMVNFADGESGQKTFTVTVNDTLGYEGRERFFVDLTTSAGVVIAPSRATVTILDDDATAGNIPTGILLNELLVNPSGIDDTAEYVELINTTGASVTLSNVYFVSFEGDSDSTIGSADLVIDLNDVTIPAGGTFVLRSPNSPLTFGGAGSLQTQVFNNSGGVLENGSNTFALVWTPAALVEGTDYDAGALADDGILELPTVGSAAAAKVIDSVAFTDFGGSDVYYGDGATKAILLQPGSTPDAAVRVVGNTTANNAASWYNADVVDTNSSTSLTLDSNISSTSAGLNGPGAPLPASPPGYTGFTAVPSGAVLTPGAANYTTPSTGVFSFAEQTFTVGEGTTTLTVTVNRTGGTGAASVDWSIGTILTGVGFATVGTDTSGATSGTLNFTGSQTSATFTVTITNDSLVEGNEVFGLALSNATGGASIDSRSLVGPAATAAFNSIRYGTTAVILDNDTAAALQGLVINEVKVDMAGSDGPFEYIEVRGTPGAVLPAGTYVVSVEGDNGSTFSTNDSSQGQQWDKQGTFDYVFDLSGQTIGSNGLLIIKAAAGGHTVIDAATTVVTDSRLDGSGGILENGSNSFLLISSPTTPLVQATQAGGGVYELASDYDRDENGTLEALPSDAVILDGIGWSNPNNGDLAYGTYLSYPFFSFAPAAAASRLASNATPGDKDGWRFGEIIFDANTQLTYDPQAGFNNVDTTLTGRALTPGGANFDTAVVDTTPPTVSSITLAGATPTNATSVQFTVTFSESVTGVDTADFALATSGVTGASITSVTGGPTAYTVTVNTGTGSGTVGLNLVDDDSIADTAGNKLGGTGTGNGNFTGQVYTIDKTAPTAGFTRAGTDNVTAPVTRDFTVTFSEAVNNVDQTDFQLALTGTVAATITGVSGTGPYTVTVNITSGSGTVGLDFAAGNNIVDAVGNPVSLTASPDEVYTVVAAPTTLQVTNLAVQSDGFLLTFSGPIDVSQANLYSRDQGGVFTIGSRDVQITNTTTGQNFGVDANDLLLNDELRFTMVTVASNQVMLQVTTVNTASSPAVATLPAGTYTVTLQGGTGNSAFKSGTNFLDGNANGTVAADDDYVATGLVVAAPPSGAVTLTLGDVTRGPGQPVSGQTINIPLYASDATDLRVVDGTFLPDSSKLVITGFTIGSVPAGRGASALYNPSTGLFTMSGAQTFNTSAGQTLLGTFQATVPSTALVFEKQILDFTYTTVSNANLAPKAFVDDDGVQLITYVGDVVTPRIASDGASNYNGQDTAAMQGVIVNFENAFALYQQADPKLAGDVNGDGQMNGNDVAEIQARIVNFTNNVPALPGTLPNLAQSSNAIDPRIYIPNGLTGVAGNQLVVPVRVQNTDPGTISIRAADVALEFDPAVLQFVSMANGDLVNGQTPAQDGGAGSGVNENGDPAVAFSFLANVVTPGQLRITGSSARGETLASGADGVLYFLTFNIIAPSATSSFLSIENGGGFTIIGNNSGQQLILIPAPTDANNDANVDNTFTVTAAAPPQVFIPDNIDGNTDVNPGLPGVQVNVPIQLSAGGANRSVRAADFKILFDPAVLTFNSMLLGDLTNGQTAAQDGGVGTGQNESGQAAVAFSVLANVPVPGDLRITGSSARGEVIPAGQTGTIYFLQFTVAAGFTGQTLLNIGNSVTVVGDNFGNGLALTPAPNDTYQPAIDGSINVAIVLNQPPFVQVPASSLTPTANPIKVMAGRGYVFSTANGNAITVSDPNSNDSNMQVTLSVPSGTLTLPATSGTGFSSTGSGTGTLVVTGTQAGITSALNGLIFRSSSATFSGNVLLTITANDQSSNFGGPLTDTKYVNITVVRALINEVAFNTPGNDAPNEYVEIRTTVPNFTFPANTFLLNIEANGTSASQGASAGAVNDLLDLAGQTTGANGILLIRQSGSTWATGDGNTITSTGTGFSAGVGFSSNNASPIGETENAGATFMLLTVDDGSTTNPSLATDIDSNNDGVIDGTLYGTWAINDSVALLAPGTTSPNFGYAATTYRPSGSTGTGISGTTLITGTGTWVPGYAARVGDSTGTAAVDWLFSDGQFSGTGTSNWALPANTFTGATGTFVGKVLNTQTGKPNYFVTAVSDVVVNNGGAQRSQITQLTIKFDSPVNGVDTSKISLTGWAGAVGTSVALAPDGLSATITFTGGADTYTLAAPFLGSSVALLDGRYSLLLQSGAFTASGVAVDLDGDGSIGGNRTYDFQRFFGDTDGDGDVDATDRSLFYSMNDNNEEDDFSPDGLVDSRDTGYVPFLDYTGAGILTAGEGGPLTGVSVNNILLNSSRRRLAAGAPGGGVPAAYLSKGPRI